MFAYIKHESKQIMFANESPVATKQILCFGSKSTTKVTTPSTSGQSDTSSKKSSQESSTTVIASAVTVAVVLSSALVIVIVLRNKGKLCFAITKGLQLENTDDSNRISLAKIESKTNENSQSPEAYLYNKNTRGCTKDIDEYADIDNDTANFKCNETGFYQTPCAPMMNHTYQEIHANDEYAGIDDVRGDNDDYDYTNKAFRDEKAESSDNVYSHLNSGGDEYDHVHRGQNIVKVVEHDYVENSGVVRN
ncbi:hypothetical protein DPMN_082507 [Dreissena polymorpha]|uniref:Uncharacterized protein n=1 Tax=Dreissena polymorpha TaxID=45954 RepID=A0A9D3YAW6_DREPO|nr:hypothetical protein DPMN_082507 [Dreissena polymorpha]